VAQALGPASAALAARLGALAPDDRRAALCDPRPLHLALFGPLLPDPQCAAAGLYRGTPGSPVETVARAVFIARRAPGLKARDLCTPPEGVAPAMAALAGWLGPAWDAAGEAAGGARPGHDAAYDILARYTHAFLAIHPFVDGNGHLYRLLAPVLARRLGLAARPGWTVHPRPYDHVKSLCIQWYPHHPALLALWLRAWFDPLEARS